MSCLGVGGQRGRRAENTGKTSDNQADCEEMMSFFTSC